MIYRRKNSPYWYVEFYHEGDRNRLSTKQKDKRAAEKEAASIQLTYSPRKGPKSFLESIKDRYLTTAIPPLEKRVAFI